MQVEILFDNLEGKVLVLQDLRFGNQAFTGLNLLKAHLEKLRIKNSKIAH